MPSKALTKRQRAEDRAKVLDIIRERGAKHPAETLMDIIEAKLTCGKCEGTGLVQFFDVAPDGSLVLKQTRVCGVCEGRKNRPIPTNLILSATSELLSYIAPKLKAVEHSGPEGGPVPVAHVLKFVK